MTNTLFSCMALLTSVLLMKEPSCRSPRGEQSGLFPMAFGNEWIYLDSVIENGKLVSVRYDTLRIERTSEFESKASYIFSDGKEFMQNGDTLFQLVTQRGGFKFATPYFIATETETSFNYAFGGDVVIQRTVTRERQCSTQWASGNCYRISDGCRGGLVFLAGTGIISERHTACNSPGSNYTSRTLVHVLFK
jgi:hypothetical protein